MPQASLNEAEKLLHEETKISLSEKDYQWLIEVMDEPLPAPFLKRALKEKPVWDI